MPDAAQLDEPGAGHQPGERPPVLDGEQRVVRRPERLEQLHAVHPQHLLAHPPTVLVEGPVTGWDRGRGRN